MNVLQRGYGKIGKIIEHKLQFTLLQNQNGSLETQHCVAIASNLLDLSVQTVGYDQYLEPH